MENEMQTKEELLEEISGYEKMIKRDNFGITLTGIAQYALFAGGFYTLAVPKDSVRGFSLVAVGALAAATKYALMNDKSFMKMNIELCNMDIEHALSNSLVTKEEKVYKKEK